LLGRVDVTGHEVIALQILPRPLGVLEVHGAASLGILPLA
jgi:hypothetical protein